jgi:hypothetical protein
MCTIKDKLALDQDTPAKVVPVSNRESTVSNITTTFSSQYRPCFKGVNFSIRDRQGCVAIENVLVSTVRQRKGHFCHRPELGCTMEIPENLEKALLIESAREAGVTYNKALSSKPAVSTIIFAYKLVDDTLFKEVKQDEYIGTRFVEYSQIPSLSTKYPLGFTMSGKFSFLVFALKFPPIIKVKVYSGSISGTPALV